MSRRLTTWGLIFSGGAAAFAGAYGLMAGAQGGVRPVLLAVALSLPVYFLIFDRVFPHIKEPTTEPGPALATNEARGRIWAVALVLSLLFCEGMTYATRSGTQHLQTDVQAQLLKRDKFGHPEAWRLVTGDGLYVYVPFRGEGQDYVGRPVRVDYRDAWLGVRFIEHQEIGRPDVSRVDGIEVG